MLTNSKTITSSDDSNNDNEIKNQQVVQIAIKKLLTHQIIQTLIRKKLNHQIIQIVIKT
ncbi:hypothetical protein K1514_01160 [Paraclostridium bifermentans]|uniref:hypothetical protein n=1 Tax=Paraclostridium bifermentans TaxID=1490 RepID=UPI00142E22D1|nr:hypothetical protein [Paraclostridium bifermentans]MBZ6004487.1 hypothetical protein [Paraclostridium bifermentans]